ncbi:ABC-type Fe3+ transport system substrate-binding protein [Azospirillum brasilense]|uniref:ABC-type Fe3+ transport system substrate-binding protein n=1 Tax=Azospirillum brasilense TaxID=192 RepID=A0A560BBM5_AZOBR|nr:extracellular solute-binding protein [Azospirillum brasilense]TWA69986.1 ABC-type Fe3+ transport system substrate-binding protein [Azospirillum brasilense]
MRLRALVVLAMGILPGALRAEPLESSLLVLTSYPDELVARFEAAFERANPGTDLRVLWKTGREAMPILRSADQGGVDVYWTPALRNFPLLRDEGRLAAGLADIDREALPGRIGAQILSDPSGRFEAFEVAGYGIVVNPAYLADRGLPTPRRWADLADPALAGHVAFPVPSRVGFAPVLVDIILQAEGWTAGWTLLQRIAASAELADRGPGVGDSVASGRRGAGPTIDFQALNAQADGKPVDILYPERTAWLPAHIGVTAAAPHPKAAAAFVAFALSEEGQRILFHPDIRRHPVRPAVYRDAPAGTGNPFAAAGAFAYETERGSRREPAVAALFDALITRRQDELRELLALLDDARRAAARTDDPALAAKAEEALALATAVPVTEDEAAGLVVTPALDQDWAERIGKAAAAAADTARAVLAAAKEP